MLSIYTDETNATEHRPLMVKQSSVPVPAQSYENPYKLEVGSIVQFGKPIEYGVIKWIGKLPGKDNVLYAGVETVSYGFIMCLYLVLPASNVYIC